MSNKEEHYSRVPRQSDTATQLKGPRGDGDMQSAKRDCNTPATCDLNIWIFERATDLSVMGQSIDIDENNTV